MIGKALILDTETNNVKSPEAIEVAWIEVDSPRGAPIRTFEQRYRPVAPISLGALATHGIFESDLQTCPPSGSFRLPPGTEYLVGHNIDFDWRVIGRPDVKRIDTLKLARVLWPTLDCHTLSAITYHAFGREAREMVRNAHSALRDCELVLAALRVISTKLGKSSWEDLWPEGNPAVVPQVMEFGKHRGKKFSEVPPEYCRWLLDQDITPELAAALKARLSIPTPMPIPTPLPGTRKVII